MVWVAEDVDVIRLKKMRLRICYERATHVVASGLAMMAQRLPFLKGISPLLGINAGIPMAAPLTVSFIGTQALTGQSIWIIPTGGATNPALGKVGEPFQWAFITSEENPDSVKVEVEGPDGYVEAIPDGLQVIERFSVWFIEGVPENAGLYNLRLTGYRGRNFTSTATTPYLLTVNIDGDLSPFEQYIANYWEGVDLNDQSVVGPNADPDGDGIENSLEFLLDLDPTRKETMPGSFGLDPANRDLLKYEIPLNALALDATVTFEQSSTGHVTDWSEVAQENVTRTEQSVVLSVPADQGKALYRLKVSLGE